MKKALFFLLLIPCLGFAVFAPNWLNVGNTLQRTADGFNYRFSLGSPGFLYIYSKPQVDSIFSHTATGVSSVNSRSGAVTLNSGDITSALTYTPYNASNPSAFISNINGITAGGDLSGTYPNPTVNTINGITKSYYDVSGSITASLNGKQNTGNYLTALTGDISATGPGSVAATLATVNANTGSWGIAGSVPTFSVNGKGLITAAANTPIQITEGQVTSLTSDLSTRVQYSDIRNAANFGLTASLSDVGHYANPNTGDQTYRVGGWINLLNISGTDAVVLQVTWTDNHGVSKTKQFFPQGATTASLTIVDDYAFPTRDFRVLTGTTVQVSAVVTGTGTITYEAGTTIQKIQGN